MPVSYTIAIPQLPSLQRAFSQAPDVTRREMQGAVNRSLMAYQSTAKQLAPIQTGQLRGSIQIEPAMWSGSTIKGSVGTNNEYSVFQEQGTGIYGPRHTPITPSSKSILAWYSHGQWHFAKQVRGSRPRWFMKGSVERNQSGTERNFQMALDAITAEIARAA